MVYTKHLAGEVEDERDRNPRGIVSLKHGNELAEQGLLGDSKWRRQCVWFEVFRCENVAVVVNITCDHTLPA